MSCVIPGTSMTRFAASGFSYAVPDGRRELVIVPLHGALGTGTTESIARRKRFSRPP